MRGFSRGNVGGIGVVAALAIGAALLATVRPAAAQLGSPSYTNASSAAETDTSACHFARRSSVANNGSPTGAAFSSRYIATVTADNDSALGGCSAKTETLATDYTINFTATAPNSAPYKLTVTTQRKGDMNLRDDGSQNASAADITAATCTLSNTTTFSGGCSLVDPAPTAGLTGGGNQNAPFDQSSSMIACGVGNGGAQSHALHFTWSQSATSPATSILFINNADEGAVRLGDDVGLGSEVASDYPGTPARTQALDGHFVTVAFQSLCGNGVVDGNECGAEQCDLGGLNGAPGSCCSASCTFVTAGTTCRAAAGICDIAEQCTGASATCPSDTFQPPTTVCRAASGGEICDTVELCTGSGATCPPDGVEPNTTVCRASAGACDTAELCDGVSGVCPADAKSTSVCRASAGACDVAEVCDGISNTCGADAKSTAVCRASAGACDVVESCDGVNDACPADTVVTVNTPCRPAAGDCDIAEVCDGVVATCPADTFQPSSVECRGTTTGEECDVAEFCTGSTAACPPDAVLPNTTVCRASAGDCDLAENCDGSTKVCPSDAKSTAECRASAGICDVAEVCDGVSDTCAADSFEPATTVCRAASAGADCDAVEFCTGSGAACPADAALPTGTVCRAASSGEECDAAETCDGVAFTCPADGALPNGTACSSDGNLCTVDACDGSSHLCQHPAGNAGTTCRASAGVCDVAEQCDGTSTSCPADASVPNGSSCSDGAFCNGAETCQSGTCTAGSSPCSMSQSCNEATDQCFAGDCPTTPSTCRNAGKSIVLVKNNADDSKDKLVYKWLKGDATTQADLADPLNTATYAVCFYTNAGLVGQAGVPPSSTKWSPISTKGYKYKDNTLAEDGIQKIIAKGGAAGKSKLLVKGKGANLPDTLSLPIAPADLPLRVQVRNNQTGICFGSSFATPTKNVAGQFKGKTP